MKDERAHFPKSRFTRVHNEFCTKADREVSKLIPSMQGYFNKMLLFYDEDDQGSDIDFVLNNTKQSTICFACGTPYGPGLSSFRIRSKYKQPSKNNRNDAISEIKRKKKKRKKRACSIVIKCLKCSTRNTINCQKNLNRISNRQFDFKLNDKQQCSTPIIASNIHKKTPSAGIKSLCRRDSSLMSPNLSPATLEVSKSHLEISSSNRKRKRKSFTPLVSNDTSKNYEEKPSLLSFLSSI